MRLCRAVDFLFGAIPISRWRAYLVGIHYDRCPACQLRLAGPEVVDRFLARPSKLGEVPDFWPALERRLDERPSRRRQAWPLGWGWRAAAAAALFIAVAVGLWLLRRPGTQPPPSQESGVFRILSTRVADEPAAAYVYQPRGSDLTVIWVEPNR